jgi:hypothetical protein
VVRIVIGGCAAWLAQWAEVALDKVRMITSWESGSTRR